MTSTKYHAIVYYTIVTAALVFIFLSNPFLKIPYDPLEQLIRIASLHDDGNCFVFWPGEGRTMCFWHRIWANIFKFTGINDFFIWAKIIHVFQFILAAFAVFYFSQTSLKLLTNNNTISVAREEIEKNKFLIKILSVLSVFLWFVGNGTFSIEYQQAWIMWYSVTYQGMTIPLLWYSSALTLKLFFEKHSVKKVIFFSLQILIASLIMLKVHPSEFLYYMITLLIIFMLNMRKIFSMKHRTIMIISILIVLVALVAAVSYLSPVQTPFFQLLTAHETFFQKIQKINNLGHEVVQRFNRFTNSFSEIAFISILGMIIFRIIYALKRDKDIISKKFYDYLLMSSLLSFLIPVVPFLAGLAGYLTDKTVVWRFFFASPWFIFIPFITCKIIQGKMYFPKILKLDEICISSMKLFLTKFIILNIMIFLIFVLFFTNDTIKTAISHTTSFKTTFLNTKSIINSLNRNKVGIQYSQECINQIGELIAKYDHSTVAGKSNILYIPRMSIIGGADNLSYIIRGVYGKYVYAYRRQCATKESFLNSDLDKKYNLIELDLKEFSQCDMAR